MANLPGMPVVGSMARTAAVPSPVAGPAASALAASTPAMPQAGGVDRAAPPPVASSAPQDVKAGSNAEKGNQRQTNKLKDEWEVMREQANEIRRTELLDARAASYKQYMKQFKVD